MVPHQATRRQEVKIVHSGVEAAGARYASGLPPHQLPTCYSH